jgi:phosphopantothenate synthetase
MPDTRHQIAETIFERTQRREKEINDALKQEYARRETAITNMHRLRALRLERHQKTETAHDRRGSRQVLVTGR